MAQDEDDAGETALVVEDDPYLGMLLDYNLAAAGYRVDIVRRGDEAIRQLRARRFDLVILDWNLPALSGLEVLRQLRANPRARRTAAVLLTARTELADRAHALEIGADAYMTKPFSLTELLARLAMLRRPARGAALGNAAVGLQLDHRALVVRHHTAATTLNPTAFRLLELLIENAGRPLTQQELHHDLWGPDIHVDERSIDIMVARLRSTLRTFDCANAIQVDPGRRYRLETA